MNETFYRKNDIGVNIEYYVIGYWKDDNKTYRIYTDFVTDSSNIGGIRLFVDQVKDKEYIPLSKEESIAVIEQFQNEIIDYMNEMRG